MVGFEFFLGKYLEVIKIRTNGAQTSDIHPESEKTATPLSELPEIVFKDFLPSEYTCPKCEQAGVYIFKLCKKKNQVLREPMKTQCDHYYYRSCVTE